MVRPKGHYMAAARQSGDYMAAEKQKHPWSRRHLLRWAIVTFVVGVSPIISSLIVELIAPSLNCLVIEHGAYTRGPSFGDDPGDLTLGCVVRGVDVGPALHALHLFLFAIFFTWPILIVSLIFWIELLFFSRPQNGA